MRGKGSGLDYEALGHKAKYRWQARLRQALREGCDPAYSGAMACVDPEREIRGSAQDSNASHRPSSGETLLGGSWLPLTGCSLGLGRICGNTLSVSGPGISAPVGIPESDWQLLGDRRAGIIAACTMIGNQRFDRHTGMLHRRGDSLVAFCRGHEGNEAPVWRATGSSVETEHGPPAYAVGGPSLRTGGFFWKGGPKVAPRRSSCVLEAARKNLRFLTRLFGLPSGRGPPRGACRDMDPPHRGG